MKSYYLLPHKYKKIGVVIFPIGLILWILIQKRMLNLEMSTSLRTIALTVSFFTALFGIYFSFFSKEPIEDEYIQSVRLKSFQLSSLFQMLFFLITFLAMYFLKIEPTSDGEMSIYLISSIVIYWVFYLVYFNLTLLTSKSKLDD